MKLPLTRFPVVAGDILLAWCEDQWSGPRVAFVYRPLSERRGWVSAGIVNPATGRLEEKTGPVLELFPDGRSGRCDIKAAEDFQPSGLLNGGIVFTFRGSREGEQQQLESPGHFEQYGDESSDGEVEGE